MLPAVILLLVKATIVLVAALGLTRALPRAPAGARHLVWVTAFAALLVVPAIAQWAPLRISIPVSWPTLRVSPARVATPMPSATPDGAVSTARRPAPETRSTTDGATSATPGATRSDGAVPARRAFGAVPTLFALWAAIALVIGGSLAKAYVAVRRIVRRARPLDAPDWRDPLWEVADRLGLSEPPRLLRSEDASMPFACGLGRPTIVLPAASDDWTPDRRRAVLLHELAHVRRRDLVGHTLARVVCAVYWFHPLVWAAAKRLRAESERACDDVALACGARPADYAEHLLEIVTRVRHDAPPAVALAMAWRTEFEGRLLDILDAERSRATPTRRQLVPLIGVLALLTVVVGATGPTPAVPTFATRTSAGIPHAPNAPRNRTVVALPETPARATAQATMLSVPRAAVVRPPAATAIGVETRDTERVGPDPATAAPNAGREAPAHVGGDWIDGVVRATVDVITPRVADAVRGVVPRGTGADRATHGPAHDDERAVLLAKVLRTDTSASLRRIAAWGLSEYAGAPIASAALVAALGGDRSADVREMAAWSLADHDRDAAGRDALIAALGRDADARVRATAAWTLGSRGERGAAAALAATLADANPQARARAAWALGNLGLRQAPRVLVALLGDPDAHVRRLAAWALFTIEDPATVPALQSALRAERDPEVQVADVRALAAVGEQSVDALRELLDSSDPRIKAMAVRALAGGSTGGIWPWPWPQPRPFP